jgi:hypothetical protein
VPITIRFPDQADFSCPRNIAVQACDGPCNILDLSATTFIKPFGITLLYGILYQMRQKGEAARVLIPNSNVATYLWRMNLHRPFAQDGNVTFEPNLGRFSFTRWLQPKYLLELDAVDVTNDDEVVAAENRIWEIVSARAPQYIPVSDQIRTAVVELLDNVRRHSRAGRATVIGQSFTDCVRIAVGDVGIGVRGSLERAYDLGGKSDHEVLQFATEAGVTGSPLGGGTGLWMIVDAIRQNGRAVHLASGQGVYSVNRAAEQGHEARLMIPGTIVEVVFSRPGS